MLRQEVESERAAVAERSTETARLRALADEVTAVAEAQRMELTSAADGLRMVRPAETSCMPCGCLHAYWLAGCWLLIVSQGASHARPRRLYICRAKQHRIPPDAQPAVRMSRGPDDIMPPLASAW